MLDNLESSGISITFSFQKRYCGKPGRYSTGVRRSIPLDDTAPVSSCTVDRKILAASSPDRLIRAKGAIRLTIFQTRDRGTCQRRSHTRRQTYGNSRSARELRCRCCCFQGWFRPGESPTARRSWLRWWADLPSRWCWLQTPRCHQIGGAGSASGNLQDLNCFVGQREAYTRVHRNAKLGIPV